MKYLSIDIEATGLQDECLIIEYAAVPFDVQTRTVAKELSFHTNISCPPLEELRPQLDSWVIEHNSELIQKAHQEGLSLSDFKEKLQAKLQSPAWKEFFGPQRINLFGKSLNAIDLPFLKRDLGAEFMNSHFSHKVLDVTSVAFTCIDLGLLPLGADSSKNLMNHFQMGAVAHTALEDAENTIQLYFYLLDLVNNPVLKGKACS